MADNNEFDGLMESLLKGTDIAQVVSDTHMMMGREKVLTPIPEMNAFLGGGLPLGVMVEAFGDPSSGKSSWAYQTLGIFQEQYHNGIAIIVDTEASVDATRMVQMGCDPDRILRIPSDTIEAGFVEVFKILDNKLNSKDLKDVPLFLLWDTISLASTNKQFENKESATGGGMMELPRILKRQLTNMIPYIEKMPMLVILLNQVTTEFTRFGSKLTSGGGYGIKHNVHLRLQFKSGKTENEGVWAVNKSSKVDMVKSKLSPLMTNMDISIDITQGGRIDPGKSLMNYVANNSDTFDYLANHGGWWDCKGLAARYPEFNGRFDKFVAIDGSRFRLSEFTNYLANHKELYTLFEVALIDDMSKIYSYQGELAKDYRDGLYKSIVDAAGINEPEVPEGVNPDTGEITEDTTSEE